MNWAKNTFGIQSRSTVSTDVTKAEMGSLFIAKITTGTRIRKTEYSSPLKAVNAYASSVNGRGGAVGISVHSVNVSYNASVNLSEFPYGLSQGGACVIKGTTYNVNFTHGLLFTTIECSTSFTTESGAIQQNYCTMTINKPAFALGVISGVSAVIELIGFISNSPTLNPVK